MDYNNLFVVLMGVGTVFIGLICIIALVWLMGRICGALEKNSPVSPSASVQTALTQTAPSNGGEIVAALSAAIAEELGTDVNAIRITSIQKI